MGNTAVAAGKLWLCSSTGTPAGFDINTGADKDPLGNVRMPKRRGSHIAALSDRWILLGGHRLSTSHDQVLINRKQEGFTAYPLDARPPETFAGISVLDVSQLPPIWDDEIVIGARAGGRGIEAWPREKLLNALDAKMHEDPPDKRPWIKYTVADFLPSDRRRIPARARFALWGPREEKLLAAALAGNAFVAAGVHEEGWALLIMDRRSGELLSATPLPAQPVMKGLCIGREGRILVWLRDGGIVAYGPDAP